MESYYLIIDIETTGLPKNWNETVENLDNWPGIIEIAWQLFNHRNSLVHEKAFLIKPIGYELSDEIQNITGITSEEVNKNGVPVLIALQALSSVLLVFKPTIVAHNCNFDTKVIQAHLINNGINLKLESFYQICTMKESTIFCDLPNLKFPKLSELYQKLFEITPNNLHRALEDVRATSKSFFKLIELGVINIEHPSNISSCDIELPTSNEIIEALDKYKSDLNKYPLFYDINELKSASDTLIIDIVQDIFNKYYQTSKAKVFEIPYNQVINRDVISLRVKDIIVRYILAKHLKNSTNFLTSFDKYDEKTINELFESQLKSGNQIVIKIDIKNCYESIEHSMLVTDICKDLNLNDSSLFFNVLSKSLKVIYEDGDRNDICKQKGLLLGSKPDEYFAEYFLEKIAIKIEESNIYVIRIADEFIFFSDSFCAAREKFKNICQIIESFNLEVNNSKTSVTDHRPSVLSNKLDFRRKILYDSSCPLPDDDSYIFIEVDTKNDIICDDDLVFSNSCESKEINSYEEAISFLKHLLHSQISVDKYQKKYPFDKYFLNEADNQFNDFRNGNAICGFSIFSVDNVEKLKKIIIYYPKNQYYSALAIQLLVFIAKNTWYMTDSNIEEVMTDYYVNIHKSHIAANLSILDLVDSNDIHDYQKYILLRCIYKSKNNFTFDFEEYSASVIYHQDEIEQDCYDQTFQDKLLSIVNIINTKTNYYPLKMICTEISNLANSKFK
jgi:DNA polymerase-3 subunit epsilon